MKQTFSKTCHEWETGMNLATSGRHDTSESTTYMYIFHSLYFMLSSDDLIYNASNKLQDHDTTTTQFIRDWEVKTKPFFSTWISIWGTSRTGMSIYGCEKFSYYFYSFKAQ